MKAVSCCRVGWHIGVPEGVFLIASYCQDHRKVYGLTACVGASQSYNAIGGVAFLRPIRRSPRIRALCSQHAMASCAFALVMLRSKLSEHNLTVGRLLVLSAASTNDVLLRVKAWQGTVTLQVWNENGGFWGIDFLDSPHRDHALRVQRVSFARRASGEFLYLKKPVIEVGLRHLV